MTRCLASIFAAIVSAASVSAGPVELQCQEGAVPARGRANLTALGRSLGVREDAQWCELDGKRHGLYVETYADRSVHREIRYPHGVRHGMKRVFHVSGALWTKGEYRAGREDGRWESFTETGAKADETDYEIRDGELWEVYRSFYPSGSLAAQGTRKDGANEGPSLRWYANGAKRSEGAWSSGREEGSWSFWRSDGRPKASGKFARGRKVGVWTEWSADGEAVLVDYGDPS